jgi:TPR repeat protein
VIRTFGAFIFSLILFVWFGGVGFAGDLQRSIASYEKGDYETALNVFNDLAEQGNSPAQYILGQIHRRGIGTTQDYKVAVKWYEKSAEQGYAKAQFQLGQMYRRGDGVVKDLKKH